MQQARDEARDLLKKAGVQRRGHSTFKEGERYFIDAGNGQMIEVVGVVAD